MIPSNSLENKQSYSPYTLPHVDTGQAHAAMAAALCALAIILVLLTAQWMPMLDTSSVSNAGEIDPHLQVDTAVPFMLRF